MKWKNIILLGTSHIAAQSKNEVKAIILKERPDIVALELDKKRLYALLHPRKKGRPSVRDIRRIGLQGWLFGVIGAWAERKLGEKAGGKPGQEMLVAVQICQKEGIPIALIDQDIEITLRKFSERFSWKERWNLLVDIFKGVILRKPEIEFDLRTVPSSKIIAKLTSKVKKRYPNLYTVLVVERNEIMAKRLGHIMRMHPEYKILAIIGAGHEKDMMRLVKKYY